VTVDRFWIGDWIYCNYWNFKFIDSLRYWLCEGEADTGLERVINRNIVKIFWMKCVEQTSDFHARSKCSFCLLFSERTCVAWFKKQLSTSIYWPNAVIKCLAFVFRIWAVPSWNLGFETGYPFLLCFFSFPLRQFWDIAINNRRNFQSAFSPIRNSKVILLMNSA
jgi:hypothetical protein